MRHFLFVLPPLAVIAAVAIERLARRLTPWSSRGLLALCALAVGLSAARMVALHPLQYIYFNDLSGGVPAAAGRFDLDYWGVSLAETAEKLAAALAAQGEANPAHPWRVHVCTNVPTAAHHFPAYLTPVSSPLEADFRIDLNEHFNWLYCKKPPEAAVLVRTERLGVTVSSASDARVTRAQQDVRP